MSNVNETIDHLVERTFHVIGLMLDSMERDYAPPPPPMRKTPITDDPDLLSSRRWATDQLALWMFCERTTCLRARRCCGRGVHCYRFEIDRVSIDVLRGLQVWLDSLRTGEDLRRLRGERRDWVAALIAWRRRFGLPPWPRLPARSAPRTAITRRGS